MTLEPRTNIPSVCTVESLGKRVYEQKASTANLIAGIILGILMVAGGVTLATVAIREIVSVRGNLPLYAEHGMSWVAAGLMVLPVGGLAIGGAWLILWATSMLSFRLVVCTDGFYFQQKGETNVFAWQEIASVEETIAHERLPIVKGVARHLMPTKTSRAYLVRRCDAKEFFFDSNVLSRPSLLAGPLATAAEARGIPWRTREVAE